MTISKRKTVMLVTKIFFEPGCVAEMWLLLRRTLVRPVILCSRETHYNHGYRTAGQATSNGM